MITITKQENGVLFTFQDSDKYLYGNGTIEVPFNTLSIVADKSDMITLKKAASNDVFISARYDTDLGYRSKDDAIDDLKGMLFAETGGGSESGITSGDVETMIDAALDDYYDKDEVNAGFDSVNATLSGKADTAVVNQAISEATQAILAVSGDVQTKLETSDFNAYSAATDARIAEDEEVTAAALNDLQENKADTSAVTAVNDALTAHTSNTGIHVSAQEKNAWNAKAEPYSAGTGIEISGNVISATGGGGSYVYYTEDTSSESATIKVQNDDGLGNRSENRVFVDGGDIIIESYNETDDGEGNTGTTDTQVDINSLGLSIIASSDDGIDTTQTELEVQPMGAYINSEPIATEPYVDAALSGKVDTSAITSAITSGSTDAEIPTAKAVYDAIPTGGGATYSAGTNISIANDTINCTLPITANTNNLQGYLLFGSNISVWGSESNGRYQIAIGKQISNPAYAQGQVAICPADTSSSSLSELTGDYPIGIGHRITSRGNGAVAIGDTANANGNGYVAIGQRANATGTTKMNLNNQIKVDTNNQVYIKDKTNTTDVCIQDAIAALGGLKFVKLTQAEYDALVSGGTVDANTLYIINNVV